MRSPAPRMVRPRSAGQLVRFASIGLVSTALFAALFVVLPVHSVRRWPMSSRCWRAPSPTRRRTAGSRSPAGGVATGPGTRCRARVDPRCPSC